MQPTIIVGIRRITTKRDIQPCLYVCNIDIPNIATTVKRIRGNARHTVTNGYARQCRTIIERTIANCCHAVGDCYACQTSAIIERIGANVGHTIGDY